MARVEISVLDDEGWRCLNEAAGKINESWHCGVEADLRLLVPPSISPFHARALVELIKIDQEYRYRNGRLKRLEAYVREWPQLAGDLDLLAELLETECMTRMIMGARPARDELRTRFPAICDRIDLDKIAAELERESGLTQRADDTRAEGENGATWAAARYPDRYQVRGFLGKGGMGTVYRAYDAVTDREVALKIPNVDLGDDPKARDRFLRESRAVAAIRHPYVCQVFDAGQHDGSYYIAMALVEGQSLAARLRAGPLDCLQAAKLAHKLAMALIAVHAVGVIHRDLKPQNVMLASDGDPRLTDFGLARLEQDEGRLTGTCSLLGTPAYMSPEQIHGEPASASSDIYALGVILYEMLTGRPPFTGSLTQIALSVGRGNPQPPSALRSGIDPELEAICLKAMAKHPEDRYASAEAMYDALWRYLETPRRGRPRGPVRRLVRLVEGVPGRAMSLVRRVRPFAIQVSAAAVAVPLLLVLGMSIPWSETGVLVLEVWPEAASVYIDQNLVPIRPPRDAIVLPAGPHTLEIEKLGFRPRTERFEVPRAGKVELMVRLTESSPAGLGPDKRRDRTAQSGGNSGQ